MNKISYLGESLKGGQLTVKISTIWVKAGGERVIVSGVGVLICNKSSKLL